MKLSSHTFVYYRSCLLFGNEDAGFFRKKGSPVDSCRKKEDHAMIL